MWICILHLPRHPKTQSAQFTFFTANRFWALGVRISWLRHPSNGESYRAILGSSVCCKTTSNFWARAARGIWSLKDDSSWFLMISHDFSWSLMISHDFSLVSETSRALGVPLFFSKCGLSPCWSMLARPLHDVFEWSQRPRRPRRRIG